MRIKKTLKNIKYKNVSFCVYCSMTKQGKPTGAERNKRWRETATESPPSNYQPFKRTHSLGKAIKRSILSLPQSPRKRQAVVSGLAKHFGVPVEKEMEASLSTSGNNDLPEEV